MLNVFPELLTYSFFAPTLLRVVLGVYFVGTALWHFKRAAVKTKLSPFWFGAFGLGELIVGALLVVGAWTQIAALVAAISSLKMMYFKKGVFAELVPCSRLTYVFVLTISLSILLTGAGAFAVDLPF